MVGSPNLPPAACRGSHQGPMVWVDSLLARCGGASQCVSAVSASCIFDLWLHRRRWGFGIDHGMWAAGLASLRLCGAAPVQAVGEVDLATRGGG